MSAPRPDRVGRYAVLAELGRGAMGVVYKARDPQLDRHVAIKTIRRDLGLAAGEDAQLRKRVYQEATAAGRLTHPNIVAVYDVLELDDIPYIVMEHVEGRTLADLIAAQGPLPPPQAVRFVTEVCGALDYAHARGVIHRDIKPSNILVTTGGVAKVSDFGIARVAGSQVTRTGAFLGTPAYMAPEQLRGRPPDARTDVFATGVTLYEALAGVPPFDGEDLAAVLYQIVHGVPAPVSERNSAVPRALETVVGRAMAKDPEARYPTALAFSDALTHAMTTRAGTSVTAATRRGDPAARSPRRRVPAALVAVTCLAVAGIGGWAAWGRWASERPVLASHPSPRTDPEVSAPAVIPPSASPPSAGPARPREAPPELAVTPRPPSRPTAVLSSPSEAPVQPAAATRRIDPEPSPSAAIVPAPPAGVPSAAPAPVEKPAPPPAPPAPVEKPASPIASTAPVEPPPEPVTGPPPAAIEESLARPVPALGTIAVSTNPSVDVFLDGEFRGRTESQPLMVSRVAPGQRLLTLRLGSREQMLLTTVNGGQTASVTHHFPPDPAQGSVEQLRDALEKGQREALDKLREGVDKAQREVVGGLRGLLDKVEGDREKRGRGQERKPDRR